MTDQTNTDEAGAGEAVPMAAATAPSAAPIACEATAAEAAVQAERIHALRTVALREQRTESGGSWWLPDTPAMERELREFANFEATCCAFATFSVERDGDALRLTVEAPPEASSWVDELFSGLPAAASPSEGPAPRERPMSRP